MPLTRAGKGETQAPGTSLLPASRPDPARAGTGRLPGRRARAALRWATGSRPLFGTEPGTQPALGLGAPVAAVQLQKDRGVGQGECGLQHQDTELLPGLVEFVNDLLVRQGTHRSTPEDLPQVIAVAPDTRGVALRYVGQLGIEVHHRTNVPRPAQGIQDCANDLELIGAGGHCLDPGLGLAWIGG